MWTSRFLRTALGIAALTVIAVVAGQAQAPSAQSQDPVVAEIRALRADLNERLEATIRTQLLVARLQVQEQRINTVVRQLQDVNTKLREQETSEEQTGTVMKMFGGAENIEAAGEDNFLFSSIKAGLAKAAQLESELKLQQTQLTGTLADEQARWVAFNRSLDELEKLFAKPAKPAR